MIGANLLMAFVHLTHMGTVVINDQKFHVLPDLSLKFPYAGIL